MLKYMSFIFLVIIVSSCATSKKQGNIDLNLSSMKKFHLEHADLKNLQYFIKGKVVWQYTENNSERKKDVDASGAAIYQKVKRKYTKKIVLDERTQGVYKRYIKRRKDALLDVDFGNDIIIRFKLSEGSGIGDPKTYSKIKFDGKIYEQNLEESSNSIELSFSGYYLESNVSKTDEVILQGKSVNGTLGKAPAGSVKVEADIH